MKLQLASLLTAIAVVAGNTSAQNSLLFAMDADEFTIHNGTGLISAGNLDEDEVGVVSPLPGSVYSAQTFFGVATQWAWRGDDGGDGRLVDSVANAPGLATDAVMIKRFINPAAGEIDPREVCISKESNYFSTARFWTDSDVYYHPTQGTVALFISETQIEAACGTAATDLDAICQDTDGDIYLSFSITHDINGTSVQDGGIVRIPASGLTYDPITGDVTGVTPGSAQVIAREADMVGFVNASGVADYNGGISTASFDLTALEIDPAGGVWFPPITVGPHPNLLFGWQGLLPEGNEGAILSTAGGGTIATINGVMMGSTFQTTGVHLGLLPDAFGVGNIHGLAVVPTQTTHLPLENYPTNLVSPSYSLWTRQELSNATPGGAVFFLFALGPLPPATGLALTSVTSPVPGLFSGEFFEPANAFVVTSTTANSLGYASSSVVFPESARGSGLNLVWQAFDLTRTQFSLPAPMQFL